MKFPVDAPRQRVIKALQTLGFSDRAGTRTYRDASRERGWYDNPSHLTQSRQPQGFDSAGYLHASADSQGAFLRAYERS